MVQNGETGGAATHKGIWYQALWCVLQAASAKLDASDAGLQLILEPVGGDAWLVRPGNRRVVQLKTDYRVTVTAAGESALTESRKGSRQLFRVGRSVYDAAAKFLAQSDRLEPFEEIKAAVEKSLGHIVPDYQLRVVIRFWVKNGLVEHRRTRFIAAAPRSKMKSKARSLWRALEKPTRN